MQRDVGGCSVGIAREGGGDRNVTGWRPCSREMRDERQGEGKGGEERQGERGERGEIERAREIDRKI